MTARARREADWRDAERGSLSSEPLSVKHNLTPGRKATAEEQASARPLSSTAVSLAVAHRTAPPQLEPRRTRRAGRHRVPPPRPARTSRSTRTTADFANIPTRSSARRQQSAVQASPGLDD